MQNKIAYTKQPTFTSISEYHIIDREIRTLIESQGCFEKKYELRIHHRKYNVFLSYPSKNTHNKSKIDDYFDDCIMKIYIWLFIGHYYSKHDCSEIMNINIYFSNHKKIIDLGVVLDSVHVNSALLHLANNRLNFVYIEKKSGSKCLFMKHFIILDLIFLM